MKKIIAIAALAAAVSTCAHAENTFDSALSGTPATTNLTTHTVTFNVNTAYIPLAFTDNQEATATELTAAGDANRVLVSSQFTAQAGHQYHVGAVTVNGANSTQALTASFSSDKSKPSSPNTKSYAHVDTTGDMFILLTQDLSAGLAAGSTNATYTVTDYAD
ncbi:hypothetical protein QL374_003090 [Salmonella enterica]|nr:hypothetical protein [Salmonella enterica]ELW6562774.1 hypothetical protein [Salmonella enterica]ELZ1405715.1 hypothetical protein [Salmonella enterica]